MNLHIGTTIRQLRRERDLTQEELASALGVTYQTVSRWENEVCYPDLEFCPLLANFFGVTVDALLGLTKADEDKIARDYLGRFQEALSRGDIAECIRAARAGVRELPCHYGLLNKLMYALFLAGDEDGNIPNWRENRAMYDEEIVRLGERIIRNCPDAAIRAEATARLAFHHCEMGRTSKGRALYESLSPAEFCREVQILPALSVEERLPHDRNLLGQGYSLMCAALYDITSRRLVPDQALTAFYQFRLELERLWAQGNHVPSWGAAAIHCELAKLYARLNQPEDAVREAAAAAKQALAFDRRPEAQTVDSPIWGPKTIHRGDFETTDSRPLAEILRDKWLCAAEFEPLRNDAGFQRVLALLGSGSLA